MQYNEDFQDDALRGRSVCILPSCRIQAITSAVVITFGILKFVYTYTYLHCSFFFLALEP